MPPTLPNAVLPQIHTQEGLEVQMQRNESKCCPMTLGQGRVIADSVGLGHCPTRDFQAKTSSRILEHPRFPFLEATIPSVFILNPLRPGVNPRVI